MGTNHRLDHDGLTFNCRIDGSDAADRWIVFCNSLVTDLAIWDAQVAALEDRYRILRYDQRGHGATGVPPGASTFAELGGDLSFLLDHFYIARCTVVGLSMGCPTALDLVSRDPGRVERLVLVDGQAETAPTGAATWQARIDKARADGMEAVADDTVSRWFSDEFVRRGDAEPLRRTIAAMTVQGFESCARALQSYAYGDVLPAIACPTLLVAGSNDGAMPANMAALSKRIAGARFVEIPGAGHIPNLEKPEAFNRVLLEFLR